MRRNHKGLEAVQLTPPGGMEQHNPGVSVVWATASVQETLHRDGKTRLLQLGQPSRVAWFLEGRPASRDEVLEAVEAVIAFYRPKVDAAGPAAARQLAEYSERMLALVPAP